MDKHDAAAIPEGYTLSVSYFSLVDATHSVYAVVEEENSPSFRPSDKKDTQKRQEVAAQLYNFCYQPLLDGLSLLLECSADDSITEAVLNCLSTVLVMGCKVDAVEARDVTVRVICKAALPQSYFATYVETFSPPAGRKDKDKESSNNNHSQKGGRHRLTHPCSAREELNVVGEPSQVVVMSTVCPIPSLSPAQMNATVMLTSRNLQVGRLLINCAQLNGNRLLESWEVVLACLQHFFWILGVKPTPSGSFKVDCSAESTSNSQNNGAIVTTAVSSELPELNSSLNKVFESTADFDDVSLHHVIASLCKLSSEAMVVGQQNPSKEPSFFPLAKLLQTALSNLKRFSIFWRPITAHLLEICQHCNAHLREWGAVCLTTLVTNGLNSLPLLKSAQQGNSEDADVVVSCASSADSPRDRSSSSSGRCRP